MSEERFGDMVEASMCSPLIQKVFRKKAKTVFTLKAQQKRAETAARTDADRSPFHWRQKGLPHLVPYLCALDIMSIEWMGGVLYRTKTPAAGGVCCDFYICKKGSRWGMERRAKP